jgi:hypothetical protein
MSIWAGKLASIGLLAVLASCIVACVVAWRYRSRVRVLMSAPAGIGLVQDGVSAAAVRAPFGDAARTARAPAAPAAATSLDANRRAAWRLSAAVVVVSALIAVSAATLQYAGMFKDEPLSARRIAVTALLQLWPALPALGVIWRWSVSRSILALVGWLLFAGLVMLVRSIEPQPLQILMLVGIEVAPPLVLIAAMLLHPATRAVAPWLVLPTMGFVAASSFGIDLLALLIEQRSALIRALPEQLGASAVFALFAVLPWLVAWWPLKWTARGLARAYARKRLCDLGVILTAVWSIVLAYQAISSIGDLGLAALAMFLPLAWIALAFRLGHGIAARLPPPPNLLVLRVFRRDAEVQALFDTVVERWRLSGNTLLIAGTDLADRTLDGDDVFAFISGRLRERFILAPGDLEARLAAFDLAPDDDGRYRVNECYCHDTTWREVLAGLVGRSDVVLMDLRGFQAHNAGCLHELAVLSGSPGLRRVVVLADEGTDRATADAAVAAAPAGRFLWIDAWHSGRRVAHEVLAALLAGTAVAAAARPAVQTR